MSHRPAVYVFLSSSHFFCFSSVIFVLFIFMIIWCTGCPKNHHTPFFLFNFQVASKQMWGHQDLPSLTSSIARCVKLTLEQLYTLAESQEVLRSLYCRLAAFWEALWTSRCSNIKYKLCYANAVSILKSVWDPNCTTYKDTQLRTGTLCLVAGCVMKCIEACVDTW